MIRAYNNLLNLIFFTLLCCHSFSLSASSREERLRAIPFNETIAELFNARIENHIEKKISVKFKRSFYDYKDVAIYPLFKSEVTDALVPGYSEVISQPMWIDKIKEKTSSDEYSHMFEFCRDYRLVARNCLDFNDETTLERRFIRHQAHILLKLIVFFENHLLKAYELGSRLESELSVRGEVSIPVYNEWVDSCEWLNERGRTYWIQCDACNKHRVSPITYLTRDASWECTQCFWKDSHSCDEPEAHTLGRTARCATCQNTHPIPDHLLLSPDTPWQCKSCEIREASPVSFSMTGSSQDQTRVIVQECLNGLVEQVELNVVKERRKEASILEARIAECRRQNRELAKQQQELQQKRKRAHEAFTLETQKLQALQKRARAQAASSFEAGEPGLREVRSGLEYTRVLGHFMKTMNYFVDPKTVKILKISNPILKYNYKCFCDRLLFLNKSAVGKRATWQYFHHGVWQDYDDRSQARLELGFQSPNDQEKTFEIDLDHVDQVTAKGVKYRINLKDNSFSQTNLTTNYKRDIRRLPERTARQVVLNEKILYHGSRQTPPTRICGTESGCDPRLSGECFYGRAFYAAENASYSHMYAYMKPGSHKSAQSSKTHCMIVCVAACGVEYSYGRQINRKLRRPPLRDPSKPYGGCCHSVSGGPFSSMKGHSSLAKRAMSRVCAFYESAQVLPLYLVEYRPKLGQSFKDIARQIRQSHPSSSSSSSSGSSGFKRMPVGAASSSALRRRGGSKAPSSKRHKAPSASASNHNSQVQGNCPRNSTVHTQAPSTSKSLAATASSSSSSFQQQPLTLSLSPTLSPTLSPLPLSSVSSPISPTTSAYLNSVLNPSGLSLSSSVQGGSLGSFSLTPPSSPPHSSVGGGSNQSSSSNVNVNSFFAKPFAP